MKLNHKDRTIHRAAHRDTQTADAWLRKQGLDPAHLHGDVPELYQAQQLATRVLRNAGHLLSRADVDHLQSFVRRARDARHHRSITQSQCWRVMNITKRAQRRQAQQNKAHKRQDHEQATRLTNGTNTGGNMTANDPVPACGRSEGHSTRWAAEVRASVASAKHVASFNPSVSRNP